jgi:uncharacterized protein (TIGR02118 family)
MTVLRVGYKAGVRFDLAYYTRKHLPLASDALGAYAVRNIEVVTCGPNPDGSHPPYQAMFSAYFDSPADVQKALESARMADVLADIPNYYDGMPEVMIGEVLTP